VPLKLTHTYRGAGEQIDVGAPSPRLGLTAQAGDMTTTGISRSVRAW
jgi:hypothetical protein